MPALLFHSALPNLVEEDELHSFEVRNRCSARFDADKLKVLGRVQLANNAFAVQPTRPNVPSATFLK